MPRTHDCSFRKLAAERGVALDRAHVELGELRERCETAEAKLATAQAQIAEYERRLFGRATERVPPVERELRDSDGRAASNSRIVRAARCGFRPANSSGHGNSPAAPPRTPPRRYPVRVDRRGLRQPRRPAAAVDPRRRMPIDTREHVRRPRGAGRTSSGRRRRHAASRGRRQAREVRRRRTARRDRSATSGGRWQHCWRAQRSSFAKGARPRPAHLARRGVPRRRPASRHVRPRKSPDQLERRGRLRRASASKIFRRA